MSTRCRIGMKLPDGRIKSIYCHWDGYKEGVGKTLQKYYKDPKKIEELLDLGDISSLGSFYDKEISEADWTKFDEPDPAKREELIKKSADCTIAYKNRGEDCPARIDENEVEFIEKVGRCCEEYMYLFKEDFSGVWRWHYLEAPYFRELEDFKDDENNNAEKNLGCNLISKIIGDTENGKVQFN